MTNLSNSWPFPGDPNGTVGSHHHIVPRFYLQQWADPNGRIVMVEKPSGKRNAVSVKNASTEKDFYTYIDLNGNPAGHLEYLLSQVEGEASTAITNVLHPTFSVFPPPPDHKHAIASLIAFQAVRGRRTRREIELQADLYARLQLSGLDRTAIVERLRSQGEEPTEERIQEAEEFVRDLDEYTFVPDPNDHLGMVGYLAWEIYKRLLRRHWYLCEFDGPVLLTCDEPVVRYTANPDPMRGMGFLYAEEVWLPLSPSVLLVLTLERQPLPSRLRVPGRAGANVNLMLAHNAYQYLFMHPDYEVLPKHLPPDASIFQVTSPGLSFLDRYNRPPDTKRTQRRRRAT